MSNTKMGFEGQLFYGNTGSTAGTQITNATDISYDVDHEMGDTTVRGAGTTVPLTTGDPTARSMNIEFTMINDITDSAFEALRQAAAAASGIAIRTKDYSAGKGFDGDCSVTMKNGLPLKGEQTTVFTCSPSRGYGRDPNPYV